jgi:putative SOS response-associated peptidase YedK
MPSSQHALIEATKKRASKLEAKGKPVDFKELLRMERDSGTTNIRYVKSKHWTRWLAAENCCVVPFNSFSEFNKAEGDDIWFALDETRPLLASPASGPIGRPFGRSRRVRPSTTSSHS